MVLPGREHQASPIPPIDGPPLDRLQPAQRAIENVWLPGKTRSLHFERIGIIHVFARLSADCGNVRRPSGEIESILYANEMVVLTEWRVDPSGVMHFMEANSTVIDQEAIAMS